MEFKDQLHREITIKNTPKRIICLVPSLTELLVDLGFEEQLVGITKFCVHPKDLLKKKTVVGGTKQAHIDRVKKLQPDFILCNKEENTSEMVADLSKIAPTYVSDIYNLEDTYHLINDLGTILNCKEIALQHIEKIKQKREEFAAYIKEEPVKKVAYFIWQEPYMVVGNSNFINEMLNINKFDNVYAAKDRYPEVDIHALRPVDYILLSTEPFPFKETHIEKFKAYTKAKVIIVDGEYFSWYGSRLSKAFDYFKRLRQNL